MEEIDISDHLKSFKEHLGIPENSRIVVSGSFGSGKTYFLDKFFKNNDCYNVIKIFPVNYSVASNEDIFGLIKFDVLFELLINPRIKFDKEYFDKLLTGQVFIQNNAYDVLEPLVETIPKFGKPVAKAIGALASFAKKFEKFHKGIQVDDQKLALDFINQIKNKTALIEEDFITQLIRTSVQQLSNDQKQSVLLIDDLDRIDPEHIFRILNVFSSHFDTESNKFFFDKIVLVCDIDNIRGIFHARYGSKIDFSGYIDKFYSIKVFRFDNNLNVNKTIQNIISSIRFVGDYENRFGRKGIPILNRFIVSLLYDLLSIRAINLRKLTFLENYIFDYKLKSATISSNQPINISDHPIIAIIHLLIELLGSVKVLKETLADFSSISSSLNSNSDAYTRIIIPLLDIDSNKLDTTKVHIYNIPENQGDFYYKLVNTEQGLYFGEADAEVKDQRMGVVNVRYKIDIIKGLARVIEKLESNNVF